MSTNSPPTERELKFAAADHDRLRGRLQELGGDCVAASAFEDNWVFDSGEALASSGKLLRIRRTRKGSKLTFKGPASFERGVKVRTEIETAINEPANLRSIFEELGYSLVRQYQKYRENWALGSVIISLDKTPIGNFAEFEGVGCERLAVRCGLEPRDAELRNYLEIYEDYLAEHPDAPEHMVF